MLKIHLINRHRYLYRISTALIYYGLSINATDIAGNKYLNFALVSGVEIPASLLNMIIMAKMSRRISLSSVFVLNGIACVLYIFVPNGEYNV